MSLTPQNRLVSGFIICVLIPVFLFSAQTTASDQGLSNQSSFEPDLSTIISDPRYAYASWGIIIVDPATGRTLYEKNADEMFAPASTTKLFSSGAILETLGPDYRFRTPVFATQQADGSGKLSGSLILKATGDLSMGGRTLPDDTIEFTNIDHGDANALQNAILTTTDPLSGLNELASQVKASGITGVSDVIIDDRLFNTTDLNKEFIISPIIVNDNQVDIIATPGNSGTAASLTMRPQTSAFTIENQLITGRQGDATEISIAKGPEATIVVSGIIAPDAGQVNRTYPVLNPAPFARTLFIEALERQGVSVEAPAAEENPYSELPVTGGYDNALKVAELTSPPLIEDVKLTLKVSQNMHADTYIMLMAAASGRSSFSEGMYEEGNSLRLLGLDTNGLSLGDGEGGVVEDRISPRTAARLLNIMNSRPYAEQYMQALPILGVDGSLATSCAEGNPACGHVYAKTGTTGSFNPLNNQGILLSKGLAGYVNTMGGKRLIFVVYVNNVPYSDVDDMMNVGSDLGSIAGLIYRYY